MTSRKHIQDELRSLGSDLPGSNSQPFSVPEGYFDGLAAVLLAKVKEMESSAEAELAALSPLLAGIPKKTPYNTPPSYFEENLAAGPSVVLEGESEILAAIGRSMPYQVPAGYFESVPAELLRKVAEPKARVVPLFSRGWMRVAAAAVIGGALLFGGYQLLNGNNEQVNTPGTARIPDTSSQQMASNEALPIEKQINQVSTKDLEEFIETVEINTARVPKKSTKDSNTKEVEELLKDVSVKEMERFLSGLPTADDDLLITD